MTTFYLTVIYLCFTYMNTFWAKPNDPGLLIDQNRGKQLLSLETQFICLFQNCVSAKPSGICGPL